MRERIAPLLSPLGLCHRLKLPSFLRGQCRCLSHTSPPVASVWDLDRFVVKSFYNSYAAVDCGSGADRCLIGQTVCLVKSVILVASCRVTLFDDRIRRNPARGYDRIRRQHPSSESERLRCGCLGALRHSACASGDLNPVHARRAQSSCASSLSSSPYSSSSARESPRNTTPAGTSAMERPGLLPGRRAPLPRSAGTTTRAWAGGAATSGHVRPHPPRALDARSSRPRVVAP